MTTESIPVGDEVTSLKLKTSPGLLTPAPANTSPVAITATWDGVRHWLDAAELFEQGKLFSQVMTGFELLALHKAHAVKPGNPQFSHSGKIGGDWQTVLQNETGLAQSTAYRYMDLARAAAPRLRKLPALQNFDPVTQPLAALPAPQREAMETAVKKLTDGKTQADFFDQLYKSGNKAPGREPGCDGTRKKLSLSEEAELRQLQARQGWAAIEKFLRAYTDKFLVLPDDEVTAQTAALEQALNPRKAWLRQPVNQREPKVIAKMFEA